MAKGFLKGLLFGGLVGGVGGLLFAPQKGDKTREELAEPLHLMADDIKVVKEDYQTVTEKAEEFQALAETMIPTFQKSMDKTIRAFEFQAEPRIARINEQLERLQAHFPESNLKKDEE